MCGTGQACGGEMEGGEGRGRGEQGLWARGGRVSLLTLVWLLEGREATVTLVTSSRREGVREATKPLL